MPLSKLCAGFPERTVAFVLLISVLPGLILIGLILRANSDEPVLLEDQLVLADGTKLEVHRFRTTGRGTAAFRTIGRFLRFACVDDFPALWDITRGQIGFSHLVKPGRK
jgi:lipopolysaccharide/colanic/teichoic acid biosynthesis glycosyltransferase